MKLRRRECATIINIMNILKNPKELFQFVIYEIWKFNDCNKHFQFTIAIEFRKSTIKCNINHEENIFLLYKDVNRLMRKINSFVNYSNFPNYSFFCAIICNYWMLQNGKNVQEYVSNVCGIKYNADKFTKFLWKIFLFVQISFKSKVCL